MTIDSLLLSAGAGLPASVKICECGQELQKNEFRDGTCYTCLNWQCPLYRGSQLVEAKPRQYDYIKPPGGCSTWERYNRNHENRKRNYWDHKEAGFGAKFCKLFESNKQTERIKKMLKRGLSVEFIEKTLSGDGH